MFGDVVRFVVWAWFPIYVELALFGTIRDPMRDFFWHTLLCTIPCVVELSVLRGVPVFGCLWPSSCSVVRIGTPSLALMNIPPYSASAADDRTVFIILHRTKISPFRGRIMVFWCLGGV